MIDVALKALAEEQADVCRVFANPTRILILWTLIEDEKSVGEIADAINASLQSTSQHLRIMKDTNVLTSRRDAQMIYYRINTCDSNEMRAVCPHLLSVARQGAALLDQSS